LAALKSVGLASVPGRYTAPLTPAWQALWNQLPPGKGLRDQLSRLFHYCSANGIAPSDVTDAVVARYAEALVEESIVKRPRDLHRVSVKGWNKAADMIADWPQVRLALPASRRNDFSLPWDAFSASLVEPFEAQLHRGTKVVDLLDDGWSRPLRPESIKTRRKQFRRYLTALTLAGRPPETLTSLKAVVELATIKAGLRVLIEHHGGKLTKDVFDLACFLKSIARRLGAPPDDLAALTRICANLRSQHRGLTPKNRERLRPFDDPHNVEALLSLAERLVAEVERGGGRRRTDALLVQTALAIALLVTTLMRVGNLAALHLDEHISRTRQGADAVVHIALPAEIVKNYNLLEWQLPTWVVRILDLYVERYRPILLDGPNRHLFPGENGGAKGVGVLSKRVSKVIRERTGLAVNPHLVRHLGAKLFLDDNPGQYDIVTLLLGHRDRQTAMDFYVGFEIGAAARQFETAILRRRETGGHKLAGRR
jgi:integrase